MLPLVAMRFTDEVRWDALDFAVFGAMLAGAGAVLELAVRRGRSGAYRAAAGIAVAAAFLLVWTNLAVGIIGSEDDPANLMYAGVLAVAGVGAAIAGFRPAGMARALSATALAQAAVGAAALGAGLGSTAPSFPEAILFPTAFFTLLWVASAALFRKAARARLTSAPTTGADA